MGRISASRFGGSFSRRHLFERPKSGAIRRILSPSRGRALHLKEEKTRGGVRSSASMFGLVLVFCGLFLFLAACFCLFGPFLFLLERRGMETYALTAALSI